MKNTNTLNEPRCSQLPNVPELSTKQSSYFLNSTSSCVSPDYHIIFILI